jgi:hypothetical protein
MHYFFLNYGNRKQQSNIDNIKRELYGTVPPIGLIVLYPTTFVLFSPPESRSSPLQPSVFPYPNSILGLEPLVVDWSWNQIVLATEMISKFARAQTFWLLG